MKRRNYKKKNQLTIQGCVNFFEDYLYKLKDVVIKKSNNKTDSVLDKLLDYPSLSDYLPYRYFDPTTDIFVNETTLGFILEITPLIGANENIVKSLDEFFRTKVPRKTPVQITLLSSKEVGDILENGLQYEKWTGNNAKHFNDITSAYYQTAALDKFDNPNGYGLTLRNYRLFITYAEEKRKGASLSTQIHEMEGQLKIIKSGLEGSYLFGNPLNPEGLINLISEITNIDMDSVSTSKNSYDEDVEINKQCINKNTQLFVEKDHVRIVSDKRDVDGLTDTIVNNYTIEHNPESFYLGLSPNNFASLMSPSLMISCPFIITFIIEVEDQASAQSEIARKFLDRDQKSRSTYAKYVPSVIKEAEELNKLREALSSTKSSFATYFFNITIFSSNKEEAQKNEQSVLNCYRSNGIQLFSVHHFSFVNYTNSYPFLPHEGLWSDLKYIHSTNRCEVFQAVNLMPIVAENKLCQTGFLAPSFRNQISFINLFNMKTDNYNAAICGVSGAGKSVITQTILYDIYKRGGRTWVIDLGESYKSFCEILGGEYWDVTKLKFNPFTSINIDINKEDLIKPLQEVDQDENSDVARLASSLEKIHKLILIMADPEGTYIDKVFESMFYQAVEYAYFKYKKNALIDHVSEYIELLKNDKDLDPSIRRRASEGLMLIEKFTTRGLYGKYFNSKTATLTGQSQLTVLEMGSLQGTPDLLAVVLYTLIISIDECMYQSPRNMEKVCTIEEAWQFLGGKSQRVGDFIDAGYRTARKYKAGFMTVTQGIKDFSLSKAAESAWNNSSIKLIAKQDPLVLEEYTAQNPNFFTKQQKELLKTFGNAGHNNFSSFMLGIHNDMFPCRLFLDPLRRTLFSSTGDDFEYIQNARKNNIDISQAIYDRACIKYPHEIRYLEEWVEKRKYYEPIRKHSD